MVCLSIGETFMSCQGLQKIVGMQELDSLVLDIVLFVSDAVNTFKLCWKESGSRHFLQFVEI